MTTQLAALPPLWRGHRRHHVTGLAVAMAVGGLASTGVAGPLNDTGIEVCRDHVTPTASRTLTPTSATVTCSPMPTHGAQDARYGRDPAAQKGQLTKVGGSALSVTGQPNGFDFTKISNSGARLPADAALGTGPNDWACTYDNNTGLLWEVKTTDGGLRDRKHRYTWYMSQRTAATGGPGFPSSADSPVTCATAGRCDTEKFVADVNANGGLCGKTDWRMPSFLELLNLADLGRQRPAIDPVYFPNTGDGGTGPTSDSYQYLTGTPTTRNTVRPWGGVAMVNFAGDDWGFRQFVEGSPMRVRLVRKGL